MDRSQIVCIRYWSFSSVSKSTLITLGYLVHIYGLEGTSSTSLSTQEAYEILSKKLQSKDPSYLEVYLLATNLM
jgi:hypothetical protein